MGDPNPPALAGPHEVHVRQRRLLRGLLTGLGIAGAVVLGRWTGLLEGAVGLMFTLVLVLLVPTSREFARRVIIAGCL